ncbi:MAG: hypothetical protein QGG88_05995 [Gammaproteobacteria bacterium]|nr:hypothetical protein [Gammaproteobacteria bacterium]
MRWYNRHYFCKIDPHFETVFFVAIALKFRFDHAWTQQQHWPFLQKML